MLPFIIALINHTTFCSLELKKPHSFCDVNFNCFLSGRPLQAYLQVPQLQGPQKDPSGHTCVLPGFSGGDLGLGTGRMFWEYQAGLRSWDRNYLLSRWTIVAHSLGGDHSIRGPTRPRLKTWDKGVFLRVFDAHCTCHP